MRAFAVDASNDLYLAADGRLALSRDLAAFMQVCEHTMQAVLGEMLFSSSRGLPYWETVWGGATNLRQFETYARKHLLGIEGARAVTAFSCAVENNTLKYQATIESVYGTAVIHGGTHG